MAVGGYHNIDQFSSPVCGLCGSVYFSDLYFSRWKIEKSCLLANVYVDGKHLRQITKINIQQRLPIVHCGNSVLERFGR